MRKHFVPFLFTESPFYFEAGVNGGWAGARPGRLVNRICGKFYREQALVPDEEFRILRARNREALTLCCGPFSDDMHHVPPLRTILAKGFGGVRADVADALAKCPANDPHGRKQLETALAGLDTVREIQLKFAKAANELLARPDLTDRQRRWMKMTAEAAKRCPWEPPKTFFEGLNTLWFTREIIGYLDGTNQFSLGRPDAMLIDLYRADIASGQISATDAHDLVAHFLILADCHYDGFKTLNGYTDHEIEIPMSLGGCDEGGKPVWNELTQMFLNAHLGCDCVFPKLHCRIGSNSPEPYLRKIASLLMANHAVFTLLNDDRYVKQFMDEGFSAKDARSYIGVGCWNGFIDSVMDVDEANYTSVIRILELTIHKNPALEKELRLKLKPLDGARTFEEVEEIIYCNFMRFFRDVLSTYTRYGGMNAKVFPHPVYSVCLRGGIESRRDTTEGGVASRPRILTLGFIGNVVDSLCAIRQLCFVDRTCSLAELLDAVRSNWAGPRGEELRRRAMSAPYWGDGGEVATGMMSRWMKRIRNEIEGLRNEHGGPFLLAIYAYREFMYWGRKTKATPDGRYSGDRLAQGFSPSEYRCKEGVTAVMNSIGALPHETLYASNANLTFDRMAMNEALMSAIIRVFAKKGSHMMQPNCNSVEELLDAQKHPERHQDIIVRVCGFSARFISLSKRWQDEVIERHRLRQ
jgi:formate C-acetyltransferase